MKRLIKSFLFVLVISLVAGSFFAEGWAQERPYEDPFLHKNDRMNLIDLLIARPLGIAAAAAGTGLFIASLPFTLPTRSVEDSFNMFVVDPWKFSFVREFPDEQ